MSDANDAPLDLRALGEVESPEVVRQALRRFRRRALVRGLVVVAVVAILVGLRIGPLRTSVADRYRQSAGVSVGAVYRAGEATVVLEKVADLGTTTTGLQLVVADPTLPKFDSVSVESAAPLKAVQFEGDGRAQTFYLELEVPASGRIPLKVVRAVCPQAGGLCAQRPLGSFVVDLRTLGLPESVWK
jgi:hypothetical protein